MTDPTGAPPADADDDSPTEPMPLVAADPATRSDAMPPRPTQSAGRRLPPWALLVGVLLIVAIVGAVLAVILLGGGGGDDEVSAYRDKVSTVMKPVVTANKQLSTALSSLEGTKATAARRKVAAAEQATTAARGGLSALTVPEGAKQTALNARQTLTRETAYLEAVDIALAHPSASNAAPTQTLAANLTGALDVIAPEGEDWSQSVSGSDKLTAWAPKAAATKRQREAAAAAKRRRDADARRDRPATGSGSSSGAPAPAASSGTDCGGGLHAGPNTTCAFAQNVQQAWLDAPGTTNTVEVYSPATGQSYTMHCTPAGNGITCSGGNNASVSW